MQRFFWFNSYFSQLVVRERACLVINRARASVGLPNLNMSDALNDCAKKHTKDQIQQEAITNTSSNGDTLQDRLIKDGYYFSQASEVTFVTFHTTQRLDLILSKQSLCRHIVKPGIKDVGIYVQKRDHGGFHWTILFAEKAKQ